MNRVKNKSTIRGMGKKDCAIVFKPNDDVELHLPKLKEDDIVPPYIELATIVMIMLSTRDEEFYKLVDKKRKDIQVQYKRALS